MNKFLNVVLKDSPLGCPFVPNVRLIDPLTTSAIIGAGASLLGSIFGSSSNSSTNAANERINERNIEMQRETNAQNAQLQREVNAQNYRMFKENQNFNSIGSVVARAKNAGVNPLTALGQEASTQPISAVAPQMSSPRADLPMRPYDFSGAFNGVVNAYNQSQLASAQRKNIEANTHGITLENELKESSMYDRLEYLRKLSKHEGYIGDLAKTQLEYEVATLQIRKQLVGADYTQQLQVIRQNEKQIRAADLQNQLYEVQLAFAPKLNEAQLRQYYTTCRQLEASIGLISANKMLSEEQAKHEVEKRASTIIENGLKGLDFDNKKELSRSMMQATLRNLEQSTESIIYNRQSGSLGKIIGSHRWNEKNYWW